MNIITKIFRFLVGGLFIFSGLIKVNDPIGTAIKLEEYFEVFAADFAGFFHLFVPYALPFAVFLVVLEVVLGIAIIINYQPRWSYLMLLVIIVFFTFLTFYSAAFDKVTDCGCFGDAIPLNPWQSFIKDIILLVMIIYLFFQRKSQREWFPGLPGAIVILITIIVNAFLAVYAIRHLPYIDFRPYAVGLNIREGMEPSAPLDYDYVMEKDGKMKTYDEYPTNDTTLTFVEMKLKNKSALPKITDYSLWKEDEDFTEASLSGEKLLIVLQDASKAPENKMADMMQVARNSGVDSYIITSSNPDMMENLFNAISDSMSYYFGDATLLKAVVRSNPGMVLLKDGTVLGKWHHNDIPTPDKVQAMLE